ncbi:MAG TPA: lipoprotein [Usitatibacter sp.]|nr:lipoprotein [Usitatibacter sp.]
MIRALAALAFALGLALAGCGQKGALRLPAGAPAPAVPPSPPAAAPSSP